MERALQDEMAEHLGHAKNDAVTNPDGNKRNSKSKTTLKGDFDEKILSLRARGMTVRDIQSHLEKMYGREVSPTLISSVTDTVMAEAKAWQARPDGMLLDIDHFKQINDNDQGTPG